MAQAGAPRGPEDLILHTVTEPLRLAADAQAGEWEYLILRIRVWPCTPKDSDDCQRGWMYCLDGEVGLPVLALPAGTAGPLCVNAPGSRSRRRLCIPTTCRPGQWLHEIAAPARGLCSECSDSLALPCIRSSPRRQPEAAPNRGWRRPGRLHIGN